MKGCLPLQRRALLSLGVGALLLSAIGLPGAAHASSAMRYVITDRRHAASLAFAQRWDASIRLEVTEGLTRLWREALLPHWQQNVSGGVAGLTSREVWTCLAEQARSQGRLSTRANRADSLVSWVIF